MPSASKRRALNPIPGRSSRSGARQPTGTTPSDAKPRSSGSVWSSPPRPGSAASSKATQFGRMRTRRRSWKRGGDGTDKTGMPQGCQV